MLSNTVTALSVLGNIVTALSVLGNIVTALSVLGNIATVLWGRLNLLTLSRIIVFYIDWIVCSGYVYHVILAERFLEACTGLLSTSTTVFCVCFISGLPLPNLTVLRRLPSIQPIQKLFYDVPLPEHI